VAECRSKIRFPMPESIPLSPEAVADLPHPDDGTNEIAPDLAYRRLAMVNVVFFGLPGCGDANWILIDTGLAGMAGRIKAAGQERFGGSGKPAAIILTHGHSDHVGSAEKLLEEWNIPVYCHPQERPYLNGTQSYPPPDTSVGGGLMPKLAPLFPKGPIDIGDWLLPLPSDGSVPGMLGWRWIHTPGHSVGHVSLWREADRALIVGDAFVTTNQESIYAVVTQAEELHGPPAFMTPDWTAAHRSVETLAALKPEVVVTGHGKAMKGGEMRTALELLAAEFQRIAVPEGHRCR
jgi:glyoxylase-like metal-dependent hydrolase (beta-lactamase superfamily II)